MTDAPDHGHRFAVYSATGVHIGIWNDGKLAADVQSQYPDAIIEELVTLDHLKAAVAAAYEDAAGFVDDGFMCRRCGYVFKGFDGHDDNCVAPSWDTLTDDMKAKTIRARTDADALAALERVKREAYERGVREAGKRLPRPKDASTWELDPNFVMKVTHDINIGGWEATMEVVEMAMLAAERALLDKEPGA